MKNLTPVTLHSLVQRVLNNFLPASIRNQNSIVNDVQSKFLVTPDQQTIATVFSVLLQAALSQESNSCIHISAHLQGEQIILHLQEKPMQKNMAVHPNGKLVAFSFTHTA